MSPQTRAAPHQAIETPWGPTTDGIERAPGLLGYWVEDHGPVLLLADEINKTVPDQLRADGGWYEAGSSVPIIALPAHHTFAERKRAIAQLRRDAASTWIDVRDYTKTGRVRDVELEGPGPRHRAAIRRLNDDLRCRNRGGRVMMTATLLANDQDTVVLIRARVRHFSKFTAENDPHGEHDFGAFTLDADGFPRLTINWKIDYFARSVDDGYSYGSEAPWDPAATNRVLTIMDASDA